MSETVPEVSVVIVVRNARAFLPACIASVRAETGVTWELVVLDNASDDGSGEWLREQAATDPRLRLWRAETNLGQGGGWRRVVRECRGQWVALLDGDDVALPGRLAAQAAVLRGGADIVAVYGRAEIIDAADRRVGRAFTAEGEEALRSFARFTMPVVNSTGMVRTEVLRAVVEELEFPLASDYDLVLRALERGRVVCVPQAVIHYRRHPAAVSVRRRVEQAACGSAISLLAARRRAGREETAVQRAELAGWAAELARTAATIAELHVIFARRAAAERLPEMEIFHARRAVRRKRWWLVWRMGRALAVGPERGALWRLAWGGPLRVSGASAQGCI